MVNFEQVLDQAIEMLYRRGRLTYRTLKRQFDLADEVFDDLKEELIYGQRVAIDEDERVLVWNDEASAPIGFVALIDQTTHCPLAPSF